MVVVVAVVFAAVLGVLFVVAFCQTSFLPNLTQTKLTFFVFATAPTLVHLPPTLAAFAGLTTVASNVTKTKAAKPNLAFCRAMSQVLHTRSAFSAGAGGGSRGPMYSNGRLQIAKAAHLR